MRKLMPLLLVLILTSTVDALRPVYAVREHQDATITGINANTKIISIKLPYGAGVGWQSLSIGPKTWLIKDNDEATFNDLKVGQRVRVFYSVSLKFFPNGARFLVFRFLVGDPVQGVTEAINEIVSGLCEETGEPLGFH